jgi:2-oxoglutarate dehydrogenase E1 component
MTDNFASAHNRDLLDEVYRQYQDDPGSVDPTWRAFFAGMQFGGSLGAGATPASTTLTLSADLRLQTGVVRLAFWYRQAGHLQADIDPLRDTPPPPHPLLDTSEFH